MKPVNHVRTFFALVTLPLEHFREKSIEKKICCSCSLFKYFLQIYSEKNPLEILFCFLCLEESLRIFSFHF